MRAREYKRKKKLIIDAISDYVREHGRALWARTGLSTPCLITRYLRVILSAKETEDLILYRDGFKVVDDEIPERVSYVISSLLRIPDED